MAVSTMPLRCATGRPVQIFDLGGMQGHNDAAVDFRLQATLYSGLMRWLWQRLSRDITLVHQQLRASNRAFWLEEVFGASVLPAESDMQRAVAAVQGLFGQV